MNKLKLKSLVLLVIAVLIFGYGAKNVFAQTAQESQSSLYVPLIGITSVPDPLALPNGPGNVTYNYAVKNFLKELPLSDIQVVDDKCSPVKFVEGDDNGNSELDYSETWRYSCVTKLSETTQSIAVVTGTTNNITATHKVYATVVVGLNKLPPLVSIVNVTKVAHPLSLPTEGGDITFVYKVNNPGVVPLSEVTVTDDKCSAMSGKLGDTNGNNLLDINEVWIYTCTMHLNQTTTNTATVNAFANGLKAAGSVTITVVVDVPNLPDVGIKSVPDFPAQPIPSSPETGVSSDLKIIVWGILSGVLTGLVVLFFLNRKSKLGTKQ